MESRSFAILGCAVLGISHSAESQFPVFRRSQFSVMQLQMSIDAVAVMSRRGLRISMRAVCVPCAYRANGLHCSVRSYRLVLPRCMRAPWQVHVRSCCATAVWFLFVFSLLCSLHVVTSLSVVCLFVRTRCVRGTVIRSVSR